MKKIYFIALLLVSLNTFSQSKQLTSKIETKDVSIKQYDFFKDIQAKYPGFIIPKKIDNLYVGGQLLQSQYSISDETASIEGVLQPENNSLTYNVNIINIGIYKIVYELFNGIIVKTEYVTKTNEVNVYFDGKKEL